MKLFEYVTPSTVEDAVKQLADLGPSARVLAGGTDLLVQMRAGRFDLDRVVDAKNIPELTDVSFDPATGLTLGAAVPCYRTYADAQVTSNYPALVDSTTIIGGIQIQGRASVGGNLCNSSPSGDTLPTLIALGASCLIAGPNGRRTVPAEEFCTGPGSNVLEDGEMLVSLNFSTPAENTGAHFLRFIPRNEMDIAIVNAGVWVELDASQENIVSARIGLGAVAPTPLFVEEAGQAVAGKPATEDTIQEAASVARDAARPINDMRGTIDQRKHLSAVLVARALRGAIRRAKGETVNGH